MRRMAAGKTVTTVSVVELDAFAVDAVCTMTYTLVDGWRLRFDLFRVLPEFGWGWAFGAGAGSARCAVVSGWRSTAVG